MQHTSPLVRVARLLALLAACAVLVALTPRGAASQDPVKQQGTKVGRPTVTAIVEQLGLQKPLRDDDSLEPGANFTGILKSPEKLSRIGLAGMSIGARVTVVRIAPDKMHVEADQVEPVAARKTVVLKVDESGKLVPMPPKP
jgi:hypothetical protein